MIHSAALRLTLWYLAIIMAISLSFSWLLYRVSIAELARQYRPLSTFEQFFTQNAEVIGRLRAAQLQNGVQHLRRELLLINLITLGVGGVASYLLARRTLKPIEAALEAQSRFTADASHELRTPLAAIQTEIEVALRNRELNLNEAKQLLKSNLEETGKLSALAEGLLRLAQVGERPVSRAEVHLADVIATALGRIEQRAGDRAIIVAGAKRALTVRGDQHHLVELVVILLENALKYSPPSSPIGLTLKRRGTNALIAVTDHGVGIAPSDQPFIFDRFYQADTARSKIKAKGYGLGLAIAKQIATAHRGSLEVESKLDQGSTFQILLPLAPERRSFSA